MWVLNHVVLTSKSTRTILELRFVYYLDGKKATLISVSEDTSISAYEKAEGLDVISLADNYISVYRTYGTSK